MHLVAQGHPRAFELLYDRHGGAAFSLAYRMVGNRVDRGGHLPGGLSVDLAQPAALPAGARKRAHVGARHRAPPRDRRAAAQPRPRQAPRERRGHRGVPRGASEQTDVEAARRDEARSCARAIGELPEEQARVIELAYFGGFSHSEIAEMLEMPHRHREGPDAARPGQAAARAGGGGRHERRATRDPRAERGAYLLGALDRSRRSGHSRATSRSATCAGTRSSVCARPSTRCRARSTPMEAPPSLKASLMQAVEADVREREGRSSPGLFARLRERVAPARQSAFGRRAPARCAAGGRGGARGGCRARLRRHSDRAGGRQPDAVRHRGPGARFRPAAAGSRSRTARTREPILRVTRHARAHSRAHLPGVGPARRRVRSPRTRCSPWARTARGPPWSATTSRAPTP